MDLVAKQKTRGAIANARANAARVLAAPIDRILKREELYALAESVRLLSDVADRLLAEQR